MEQLRTENQRLATSIKSLLDERKTGDELLEAKEAALESARKDLADAKSSGDRKKIVMNALRGQVMGEYAARNAKLHEQTKEILDIQQRKKTLAAEEKDNSDAFQQIESRIRTNLRDLGLQGFQDYSPGLIKSPMPSAAKLLDQSPGSGSGSNLSPPNLQSSDDGSAPSNIESDLAETPARTLDPTAPPTASIPYVALPAGSSPNIPSSGFPTTIAVPPSAGQTPAPPSTPFPGSAPSIAIPSLGASTAAAPTGGAPSSGAPSGGVPSSGAPSTGAVSQTEGGQNLPTIVIPTEFPSGVPTSAIPSSGPASVVELASAQGSSAVSGVGGSSQVSGGGSSAGGSGLYIGPSNLPSEAPSQNDDPIEAGLASDRTIPKDEPYGDWSPLPPATPKGVSESGMSFSVPNIGSGATAAEKGAVKTPVELLSNMVTPSIAGDESNVKTSGQVPVAVCGTSSSASGMPGLTSGMPSAGGLPSGMPSAGGLSSGMPSAGGANMSGVSGANATYGSSGGSAGSSAPGNGGGKITSLTPGLVTQNIAAPTAGGKLVYIPGANDIPPSALTIQPEIHSGGLVSA